jgi:hypothetical protein
MMVHEALASLQTAPRNLWQRAAPFAGLLLGPLAWGLDQPISAFSVFTRCYHAAGTHVIVTSIVCTLLALAGTVISWRSRTLGGTEGEAVLDRRHFVAIVSTFTAAMIMFALIAGTVAGVILRCEQ